MKKKTKNTPRRLRKLNYISHKNAMRSRRSSVNYSWYQSGDSYFYLRNSGKILFEIKIDKKTLIDSHGISFQTVRSEIGGGYLSALIGIKASNTNENTEYNSYEIHKTYVVLNIKTDEDLSTNSKINNFIMEMADNYRILSCSFNGEKYENRI